MSELKPCPFCGKKIKEVPGFNGVCGCESDNCQGSLVEYMTLDEWNTRPVEDALRARIAELEQAQRWIPVSERLPDASEKVQDVLCYNAPILEMFTRLYFDDIGFDGWAVTHWMPLPLPPEDK